MKKTNAFSVLILGWAACMWSIFLWVLLWPTACMSTGEPDVERPEIDYSEPSPEAATEMLSALAVGRTPPPFIIPRPSKTVEGVNKDAWYLRGSTTDLLTEDTLFRATGTGRAAVITDMPPASHRAWIMRDCVLEGGNLWGHRGYRIGWGSRIEHVLARNAWKEHSFYLHPGPGLLEFDGVRCQNAGAQAIQLRLTAKPTSADPDWNVPREIVLTDVQALECGQLRGAGRAGFSVSIKAMGPQTNVTLRNVFIQTVQQTAVKVYNGQTYDSFGALCVEHCDTLTIDGGYIDMKNPDRKAIQLFDFAWKGKEGGSPRNVFIDSLELGNEDLIVRVDDTDRISITNPKGTGRIWLQRWVNGMWRTDSTSINWTHGYQQ